MTSNVSSALRSIASSLALLAFCCAAAGADPAHGTTGTAQAAADAARGPETVAEARERLLALVPDADPFPADSSGDHASVPSAAEVRDPLRICAQLRPSDAALIRRRQCWTPQELARAKREAAFEAQALGIVRLRD